MNMQDAINDALNVTDLVQTEDIESEEETTVIVPAEPMEIMSKDSKVPTFVDTDLVDDYKMARNILYSLTEVNSAAIGEALQLVREIQHPRSFEVLNQLLSNMRGISSDLIKLQKEFMIIVEKSDIDEEKDGKVVNNVQNNVVNNFNGTTEDILKQLEQRASEELGNEDE